MTGDGASRGVRGRWFSFRRDAGILRYTSGPPGVFLPVKRHRGEPGHTCLLCGIAVDRRRSRSTALAARAWLLPFADHVATREPSARTSIMANAHTQVAIVLPTHPPRFKETNTFLSSVVACAQFNMYHVILVFSSRHDLEAFHDFNETQIKRQADSTRDWIKFLTVDPRGYNPVSYKKIWGVKNVFSGAFGYDYSYAMTLDVDSVFQSTGNFTSYFKRWSERRAVLASVLVQNSLAKTITETITIRSCEIVGLSASKLTQPVPNLWWNDAPVYEKRGFDEFFSRINWTLVSDKIRPLTFGRYTCCEPAAFEHSWYLCYKALVEGWEQVRVIGVRLEHGTSRDQDHWALLHNYSFLWSRDFNPQRAIVFHMDRLKNHQGARHPVCNNTLLLL